jgi:hypothetical protein
MRGEASRRSQELEEARRRIGPLNRFLHRRARTNDLRPRLVEQVVREPVDARRDRACLALAAAEIPQARVVAQDQVEAVVIAHMRRKGPQEGLRRFRAEEESGDEAAAGTGRRALVRRVAEIGHGAEASVPRDPHPCPAGLEVTPGEELRVVGPPARGLGGALAPLVPVGGHHEREVSACAPRDDDEAQDSGFTAP